VAPSSPGAGTDYREPFRIFRPDLDFAEELRKRDAAGVPDTFLPDDLYPDALPCLIALRAAGYRLGVVGNQPANAVAALRRLELPVDLLATSGEWGVQKPDPAFFARLAAELGLEPDEVAYVGDRVDNDVGPAAAAGMVAVFVRRGPWGWIQAPHDDPPEASLTNREPCGAPAGIGRAQARAGSFVRLNSRKPPRGPGVGAGRLRTCVSDRGGPLGQRVEVLVIRSRGNISMIVRPAFRGPHEEQPARPDQGRGAIPTVRHHVGHRHAAVGTVDDQREPVLETDLDRDLAELDGRPQGGDVGRHRDEDPIGALEDRHVQRAVRRVEIDHDEVVGRPRREIASATRRGSRMSVFSGEDVNAATASPTDAATRSRTATRPARRRPDRASCRPPSGTWSRPSDVVT
jgi:HAD superfamily hydrolase (TIGR01509 family)